MQGKGGCAHTTHAGKAAGALVTALLVQTLWVGTAGATIDNIVTVRGTAAGGPVDGVEAQATESVDVVDADPRLQIVKTHTLNDETTANGLAELGETTTYLYTVTNIGNVTIRNVVIQDTHEGTLLTPAPSGETILVEGPNQPSDIGTPDDGVIDLLDVGAVASFTITLPITQEEIDNQ